jgi:putative tryptophan/tyrosine transport system substrate-binding protein
VRRREFITLVGSAAACWPLVAFAQQSEKVRLIGVLSGAVEKDAVTQKRLAAFRDGLAELGWIEGRNLRFEIRWSGGNVERMHGLAAELVSLNPDVILAHGTAAIAAMKPATTSIPTVFVVVNDPVAQGYVTSVGHPGGNITGFSYMDYSMLGKALGLLKEIAPGVLRSGFIFNPDDYPYYDVYLHTLKSERQTIGIDAMPMRVHSDAELEDAVAKAAAEPGGSLFAAPSTFALVHRQKIIEIAAMHRLPAIYGVREAVAEGGLMSYAPDQTDIFKRSVSYVDRILRGAKPGDLPIQTPTKFEFFLNLKTAKTLGLTIPSGVLAIADEVIE